MCIPWADARAVARLLSLSYQNSGLCACENSQFQLSEWLRAGRSALSRSRGQRHIFTGWRSFRIGVFRANFGGDTVSRLGIVVNASTLRLPKKIQQLVKSAAARISTRMKTYWILGLVRHCGRLVPW